MIWQWPAQLNKTSTPYFAYVKAAMYGTRGAAGPVLLDLFFGPAGAAAITGSAAAAQVAQTVAASGIHSHIAVKATAQASQTLIAEGVSAGGEAPPPPVVTSPAREPRFGLVLPPEPSQFKPLPVRGKTAGRQVTQRVRANGYVREHVGGNAWTRSEKQLMMVRGSKNTFNLDWKMVEWIIEFDLV